MNEIPSPVEGNGEINASSSSSSISSGIFFCFNISFSLRNRKLVIHIVTRCRWIHWSEKTAALRYATKGFPCEYVWAMTGEIPYWWRVTPQGFFNQSEALPRSAVGSDSLSVCNFCPRSSVVIPRVNQWTVVSRNVGGFLRPGAYWIFFSYIIMKAEGTLIAHVRHIKTLTWLRGFRVKIAIFLRLQCLAIPWRAFSTKKTKPIRANWPEILGVMWEL